LIFAILTVSASSSSYFDQNLNTGENVRTKKWKYFFAQRIGCLLTVSVSNDKQFRVLMNMACFRLLSIFLLREKFTRRCLMGCDSVIYGFSFWNCEHFFSHFFFVPLVHSTCWQWNL